MARGILSKPEGKGKEAIFDFEQLALPFWLAVQLLMMGGLYPKFQKIFVFLP